MKYSAIFVAVFAGLAAAQTVTTSAADPTGTDAPSACIMACVTDASATAGCSGIDDTECFCGNSDFQTAAASCLTQNCPDQVQAALQLEQQICGASSTDSATDSGVATETDTETDTATSIAVSTSSVAASMTSRATSVAASVSSRASSVAGSASSVIASLSSHAASATSSPNAAAGSQSLNFGMAGIWTALALGGVAVAQLAL